MNNNKNIADQFSESVSEFWNAIGSYLPKVFGALLLLVLAVIVAKLAQTAVVKGLQLAGVDKLAKNKNVSKGLKTAEIDLDFIAITGRIIFWVVIIIFALTIADVLGLSAMSEVISGLLGYLPSVLAAAIVLTVTVAGARLIRDVVSAALRRMRVDYGHIIGNITFYLILVFGTVMAIDQLGFDTTILTANITIIVTGFVLALALAFGLGGRDLAGRLLEDAYSNVKKAKHKK
ncbi:hypothetical protein KY385_01695 [Candidatus Parcubacteria bacterium]|nr:hypothetical protein [Candidatus Parcubacteria bacterium]